MEHALYIALIYVELLGQKKKTFSFLKQGKTSKCKECEPSCQQSRGKVSPLTSHSLWVVAHQTRPVRGIISAFIKQLSPTFHKKVITSGKL